MNDLTTQTAASVKDALEKGISPAEYFWPFNGLRPNGELFGMDMAEWVVWASALHPEYVDEETGHPLLYDFVFTQMDEDLMGIENLAGTVMVTIRPDLDPSSTSYANEARKAAIRYPANQKVAARFSQLAERFAEKGM